MTDDRRLTDANLLALNGRDGEASGKLADWLKDQDLHALRRLVIRGMLAELDGPLALPEPDPPDARTLALVAIAQEQHGELKPDTATHTHRIEIRSSHSNNLYMVSYCRGYGNRPEGWECNCMGWKAYHSRFENYRCTHLKNMVPALEAATGLGGALAS